MSNKKLIAVHWDNISLPVDIVKVTEANEKINKISSGKFDIKLTLESKRNNNNYYMLQFKNENWFFDEQ